MKLISKPLIAVGLAMAAAAPFAVSPAFAQVVKGIGVVDQATAVANSNAFKVAQQQREATYASALDQAKAREQAITAQLKPMVDKLQADANAANPNKALLQQQYAQIQQIQATAQNEIGQLVQPFQLSGQYVLEQIGEKWDDALKDAMNRTKVTLILREESTMTYNKAYDITAEVTASLNAIVPSVQVVPPAGWVPPSERGQQGGGAQGGGQAAPQAPAPSTGGR